MLLERRGGRADLVLRERRDEAGDTLLVRRGLFCLAPADPRLGQGARMVDICLPRKPPSFFRIIYPVMLGVSVLCLFISNIIYLVLPHRTFLNIVMFHYTLMLFLAYLLLVLIQTTHQWSRFIDNNINRLDTILNANTIRYCPSYRILCKSLAFMEQFTFVSAMSWQTLIGHNNIQRLQGTSDTSPFGVKHLLAGYGLPAILSAVTATVEFAGEKCAFYKPRFGERSDIVGPKASLNQTLQSQIKKAFNRF